MNEPAKAMNRVRTAEKPGHALAFSAFLSAAAVFGLLVALRGQATASPQDSRPQPAAAAPPTTPPSKAVIGKLPITELSDDEAILHGLNRLGYGPLPGHIEAVSRNGLNGNCIPTRLTIRRSSGGWKNFPR